jgi:hypothetical protein
MGQQSMYSDVNYIKFQPSYEDQTTITYTQELISRSENSSCKLFSCFSQEDFVMEKPKNVILEDIDESTSHFFMM